MAKIEGIVPDIEKKCKKMYLPGFPTHNKCIKGNDEYLFCYMYTGCDIEKRAVFCGTCPVWTEYESIDYYY
jgi:hypothetical protein